MSLLICYIKHELFWKHDCTQKSKLINDTKHHPLDILLPWIAFDPLRSLCFYADIIYTILVRRGDPFFAEAPASPNPRETRAALPLTTANHHPRLTPSPSPEGPVGSPRDSLWWRQRGLVLAAVLFPAASACLNGFHGLHDWTRRTCQHSACAAAQVPADLVVGGGALPAGGLGSGRPQPDLVVRVEGGVLPCVVHKGAEDDAMAAGGLWRSRLRQLWPWATASYGLGRRRATASGGSELRARAVARLLRQSRRWQDECRLVLVVWRWVFVVGIRHIRPFSDDQAWPSEDHVWFEDRWMVASLCDEWLTMLCGLILG
jgi:hypothetical protein